MNGKFYLLTLMCGALVPIPGGEVQVRTRSGALISGSATIPEENEISLSPYWSADSYRIPLESLTYLTSGLPASRIPSGVEVLCTGGSRLWLREPDLRDRNLSGMSSWNAPVQLHLQDVETLYLSKINVAREQVPVSSPERPRPPRGFPLQRAGQWPLQDSAALDPDAHLYEVAAWPDAFLLEVTLENAPKHVRYQILCSGPEPRLDGRVMIRVSPHRVTVTVIEPDDQNRLRSVNFSYPLEIGQDIRSLRVMGNTDTGEMQLQVSDGPGMPWLIQQGGIFPYAEDRASSVLIQQTQSGGSSFEPRVRLVPWGGEAFPEHVKGTAVLLLHSGEQVSGEIIHLSSEELEIRESKTGHIRSLNPEEVFLWRPGMQQQASRQPVLAEAATSTAGERFLFEDISLVPGDSDGPSRIHGRLQNGGELRIPLRDLRFVKLARSPRFPENLSEPNLPAGMVELLNGDRLAGSFLGLTGSTLRIRDPDSDVSERRVRGAAVRSLGFTPATETNLPAFRIWMTNGCTLPGKPVSLDQHHMDVETPWGELLSIDRSAIHRLEQLEQSPVVDRLLDATQEGWSFYDGTFLRLQEQPDAIEVTARGWQLQREGVYIRGTRPLASNRVNLRMQLFGMEKIRNGQITLEFNGFSNARGRARQLKLRLNAHQLRGELFHDGQIAHRWSDFLALQGGEPLEVFVRIHDDSDLIRVEVPDQTVWERSIPDWSFARERMPHEVRLSVSAEARGITLRTLEVHEGVEMPIPELSREEWRPDLTVFRNGDRMDAFVDGMTPGYVRLRTGQGTEIPMPLERIAHLFLGGHDPQQLRRSASHARFVMNGGREAFLAEVLGGSETSFQVRREGISDPFEIPVHELSAVEFNPYYTPRP